MSAARAGLTPLFLSHISSLDLRPGPLDSDFRRLSAAPKSRLVLFIKSQPMKWSAFATWCYVGEGKLFNGCDFISPTSSSWPALFAALPTLRIRARPDGTDLCPYREQRTAAFGIAANRRNLLVVRSDEWPIVAAKGVFEVGVGRHRDGDAGRKRHLNRIATNRA